MGDAFKDLIVWQRAVKLSLAIYKLTASFPDSERFGLTNQLRRASVSVASNIAEGRGRGTDGEFRQFLNMAQGSAYEVQTQLLVTKRLKIGDEAMLQRAEALCIETSKMLGAFIQSLKS